MKKKILFILIFLIAIVIPSYAKQKGSKVHKGFKADDYGICYYYDEDKYYNDGFHLVDDNGDKIYEYQYFTLSGHILKDSITPNGFLLNNKGYLTINNEVYRVSELDILNNNYILQGKIESNDEIKLAFKLDYTKNFDKWLLDSNNDIYIRLSNVISDLTSKKVEDIRNQISIRVKDIKTMAKWYEDRLYKERKDENIDKSLFKAMDNELDYTMSTYVNNFRDNWIKVIRDLGY